MGADYLWTYYELAPEPLDDLDVEAVVARLRGALDAASDAAVLDAYNDVTRRDEDDASEARAELIDALDVLTTERRDVAMSSIGGVTIVHTGGPTWGDSPTDAWDSIIALWALDRLAEHGG
jgi:hypothetical protein